jgi:NADPH:quinone reductase-like Zn-dependent oxidoreductase
MPTSTGYSISIDQVQYYTERLIEFVSSPAFLTGITLAVTLPFCFMFWLNARPRLSTIPPYRERVLILGASSGTGEQLALEYAARGCRHIVLVGRREELLLKVKEKCQEAAKKGEEWRMAQKAPGWEENVGKERYWVCKADCSNPVDVSKIRDLVMKGESRSEVIARRIF